jgi:hypothetical protein
MNLQKYNIMRDSLRNISMIGLAATAVMLLLMCSMPSDAEAQRYRSEWLNVGEMANVWTEAGGRRLSGVGNFWPYIMSVSQSNLQGYWNGLYVSYGAKNFTDHRGETFPYYTIQMYPTDPIQKWPTEFKLVSKYEQPAVIVDGNPSHRNQVQIDEVDPTMAADRKIVHEYNTMMGLTVRREISHFSQEYHDNYNVLDITLTNTGETNAHVESEEFLELQEQELEGVYMAWAQHWSMPNYARRAASGVGYGRWMMHQIERNDTFRASYAWGGRVPHFDDWDPLGYPAIDAGAWDWPTDVDTSGRLVGHGFVGNAAIHADASASDPTNDTNQPSTMLDYNWGKFDDLTTTPYSAAANQQKYEEIMSSGIKLPYHADRVEPSGDYAHGVNDPELAATAGFVENQSYGPYDLAPGESVNIVMVNGVDGLDHDATVSIGADFKELWEQGNQYGDIEFDANHNGTIEGDEVMDKNEWVMTGRDSLFKTFRRAHANYNSGYSIPQPPRPPSRFEVTSGVGQVLLEWEYEGSNPANGFEIYRGHNTVQGAYEDNFTYQHIATVDGDARSYADDHEVERGIDYFYYIQAVGPKNTDDTGMTPTDRPLKSSRYYTQTYTGAQIKRVPGDEIASARVVPNPFHIGSSENVRYPGAERLGFLDIPGKCTIYIFTERGDLVRTIEHTDGTGDEYWNLQTNSEQMVVSGLYIASIEDHETGNQIFRKFVIIR